MDHPLDQRDRVEKEKLALIAAIMETLSDGLEDEPDNKANLLKWALDAITDIVKGRPNLS